ncbi:MAG TPA: hypothetical protein VK308_12940 [Pyrinomonadaceae bacterium]|nr:hypothetical protein [Pyrinomonadaceae bacterium]
MSKIYDKAFKVGFGINLLLFLTINILSYFNSYEEYSNREIKFAHSGYSWGFPFEMYRHYFGYPSNDIGFTLSGVVLNTFVIVICGFILGFLFKSIWAEDHEDNLQ